MADGTPIVAEAYALGESAYGEIAFDFGKDGQIVIVEFSVPVCAVIVYYAKQSVGIAANDGMTVCSGVCPYLSV